MAQAGRPVSRGLSPTGGVAPPGGGGQGPMMSTQRQGTAMRGVPPGTAAPLNTRQGTAMRKIAAQGQTIGVGAHAEVKVSDRPMTMHGLSGMKTGSLGPKWQVDDKSYCIGELRKRCRDLQEEVEKLNKEAEEVRRDNQLDATLDKRYDQLVKTVQLLEGDLADHNLATDKQRTDTQPEDAHHMYMMMKQQNDQLRAEVDYKSYCIGELRKRCRDLQEEVEKMNKEAEEVRQDNQLDATLDKRYDQLVKTVQLLVGDLADHNLATDKQRTDTQPEDAHHMYMMMKQQNDQLRAEVTSLKQVVGKQEATLRKRDAEVQRLSMEASEARRQLSVELERARQESAQGREFIQRLQHDLDGALAAQRSDMLPARCSSDAMMPRTPAAGGGYPEAEAKQEEEVNEYWDLEKLLSNAEFFKTYVRTGEGAAIAEKFHQEVVNLGVFERFPYKKDNRLISVTIMYIFVAHDVPRNDVVLDLATTLVYLQDLHFCAHLETDGQKSDAFNMICYLAFLAHSFYTDAPIELVRWHGYIGKGRVHETNKHVYWLLAHVRQYQLRVDDQRVQSFADALGL